MIQDIVVETAQAMNAMQLSMSYSVAVNQLSMEAQEATAQMISQITSPPPPPSVSGGQLIDTYA